ncbi:MAG: TGS domain-containing protein [Chloroflexota bacterium]|nr:TGS domain-containing protein [Chloroflexota bacterium]
MPTNLPPDYFKIEEEFRKARSNDEKIALLQEMMSVVPKHKGTDRLRADLRRKLAALKRAPKKRKTGAQFQSPYHIDREGAGQAVLVGPPNTGKSALLRRLTNATPEVAPYPFTTWTPTPGMMVFENVQIQLIDTPPLNEDHVEPEMMNLIRRVDLVLLVIDLQAYPIEGFEGALALLKAHRIAPSHRAQAFGGEKGWSFKPFLVLVNKSDNLGDDEDVAVLQELFGDEWTFLPVSAESGRNLDEMKREVFDLLEIIRVYSQPPGQAPDRSRPFVLDKGSTVEDFAAEVHRDFVETLKAARIWGAGVYDGQNVGRDHVLHDGDVVELRT